MYSGVIVNKQEFKVLKSVVRSVVISMVDLLICEKRSAQVLLHDVTMFKHIVIIDSKPDISIIGNEATALPVAVTCSWLSS